MNPFQTPIEYLKGVGLSRADVLKKELGLATFEDLLRHFPYKYIDRTRFYKVRDIEPELPHVQVIARIIKKEILGEKHTKRLVIQAQDDTGVMELVWFQGLRFAVKKTGLAKYDISLAGNKCFFGIAQMAHPEIDAWPASFLARELIAKTACCPAQRAAIYSGPIQAA